MDYFFKNICMRQLGIICALLGMALHGWAQQDTTKADTVIVGGITIVNRPNGNDSGVKWDSTGRSHYHHYSYHSNRKISTQWFLIDFGFDNYQDNTNYTSAATQALSP